MNYIKYLIEGFVEIIGVLPFALILQLLIHYAKSPFLLSIIVVLIVYIITIFVTIKSIFYKTIKTRKTMTVKAIGWIIALIIIVFIFNNEILTNSEVIPETIIWITIVVFVNFKQLKALKGRSDLFS